jgi:AraC-like DNA-binding protein
MASEKSIDILRTLYQLVDSLKPFADAEEVNLRFHSEENRVGIGYLPSDLLMGLMILVVRMIDFSRAGHSIQISAELIHCNGDATLRVMLKNEKISTRDLTKIKDNCKSFLADLRVEGNSFEWLLPVKEFAEHGDQKTNLKTEEPVFSLPVFYKELRKHLQFHFSKPDKLMELLSRQNERAATFLKEVNQCILTNISDDKFDANRLSRLMHMSRIQLYRRLKPLIKQSPADYIRSLRLQKAKELLETTDLRVGEVAFQTGFQSPSHFTQVFIQNYGVRPSLFSRKARKVTNE